MADLMMALMPKSRGEARLRRISRYNDGRPCEHGHDEGRYTASGRCVVCSRNANNKQPRNGYQPKIADANAFNHRGAPLRDFTPEELSRDLSTQGVATTGPRH